jgi:hypothetical protein
MKVVSQPGELAQSLQLPPNMNSQRLAFRRKRLLNENRVELPTSGGTRIQNNHGIVRQDVLVIFRGCPDRCTTERLQAFADAIPTIMHWIVKCVPRRSREPGFSSITLYAAVIERYAGKIDTAFFHLDMGSGRGDHFSDRVAFHSFVFA